MNVKSKTIQNLILPGSKIEFCLEEGFKISGYYIFDPKQTKLIKTEIIKDEEGLSEPKSIVWIPTQFLITEGELVKKGMILDFIPMGIEIKGKVLDYKNNKFTIKIIDGTIGYKTKGDVMYIKDEFLKTNINIYKSSYENS